MGQYKITIQQSQLNILDSTWQILQQIKLKCGNGQVKIETGRDKNWANY